MTNLTTAMTQNRDGKPDFVNREPQRQPVVRLSLAKKLVFSGLAAALFFVCTEACLYLVGIQPVLADSDPFVGFAKHLPLFVEKTGDSSRVVTAPNKRRWFNEQEFTRSKPANTYRVFCLGGSTTYGRPYDDATSFSGWLRELMPAADSSRTWEVINAGGISYASYRVALVLEEISAYEPDLIIVYTGHNEFLEHRTYDNSQQSSPITHALHRILAHTRTYATMHRLVSRHDNSRAEASDIKPDLATNILPAEVVTKLDKGVGPDAYTRDDRLRDQVVDHFRLNLRRIANIARSAAAKVVFVTPASNLRSCAPFKSEFHSLTDAERDKFVVSHQRARMLFDQAEANDALVAIDAALSIDDRYATAHYLRGRILDRLQRYEEAKQSYIRAKDEDICPLRALTPMRPMVIEEAKRLRLGVVDFEQIVEANSPEGIAGENLFLDHVHPTIEGHRLLALAIFEELVNNGIVKPSADWSESTVASVTHIVESRVDREANGVALRNLAKVLAWAGKQEEADKLAVRAANLLQNDANAQYLAGSALIEQGNYDAAIEKLRQVIQVQPDHAMAVLSLGAAYQMKSMLGEAEQQFRRVLELDSNNAAAHNNLGALYMRMQQWDEARQHLTQAVQLNSRYAKAFHNLGIVCSKQKKVAEAIRHMRKAVEIDPRLWKAHEDLANLHRTRGSISAAISHYRQALRENPNRLMTANSLSWLLATTQHDNLRNGEEALRWALHCGDGTNYQNPGVFNTLAAAYAETGDFDNATSWQQKALAVAPEGMKEVCRKRIELYRKRQAFRE